MKERFITTGTTKVTTDTKGPERLKNRHALPQTSGIFDTQRCAAIVGLEAAKPQSTLWRAEGPDPRHLSDPVVSAVASVVPVVMNLSFMPPHGQVGV